MYLQTLEWNSILIHAYSIWAYRGMTNAPVKKWGFMALFEDIYATITLGFIWSYITRNWCKTVRYYRERVKHKVEVSGNDAFLQAWLQCCLVSNKKNSDNQYDDVFQSRYQ